MRAAERAKTSSRSREEFTSSPISASVAKTSAEISVPVFVVSASACAPGGFMDSLYYSRRRRARLHSSMAFQNGSFLLYRNRSARHGNPLRPEDKFARPLFLCSLLRHLGVER